MTLVELKDFINNKIVPTSFMIFIDKDNKFLTRQYVEALGKLTTGGINRIQSIYEPLHSSLSLLTNTEDTINLLVTDKFEERAENYFQFENTIVICEEVDKSLLTLVEDFIITMPKFETWQLCDYVKTFCPVLEDTEIEQFVLATNSNIERITNEITKVSIFPKEEQKEILASILFDPQTDLYNVDLFKIVNAITDGDLPVLFDFLRHKNYEALEPVMIANRVLSSLKNILIVTQNLSLSAEECGVSVAQYNTLKRKYKSLNIDTVRHKIKFLNQFDIDLKTSKLDMSKQDMLNYLITHLAYRIN